MDKTVYIASGLENADAAISLVTKFEEAGWSITYKWWVHGSVQGEGEQVIRDIAVKEREGVLAAAVVVVLLPGGRGTHVEMGMAIGAKKPVVLYTADRQLLNNDQTEVRSCAFYFDPCVIPVFDVEDILCNCELYMPRSEFDEDDDRHWLL